MRKKQGFAYTFWEKTGYTLLAAGILALLFMSPASQLVLILLGVDKIASIALTAAFSSLSMVTGLLLIRGGWKESAVRDRFITAAERIQSWKERRRIRRKAKKALKKQKKQRKRKQARRKSSRKNNRRRKT